MSISCRGLRVTDRGRHRARGGLPGGRRRRDGGRARSERRGEVHAAPGPRPPRAGGHVREVLLDGEPVAPAQLRAAVAAVLQRPVLQRASVLDNAAAGLRLRGMRRAPARRLARPWLDALGIAHLADRHARTLSGGEAQRVAIARALAVRSRVLLLDEPFAGLDATTRADLIADLRTALDRSTAAVLLVTHDRDEAAALAHRTALLAPGSHPAARHHGRRPRRTRRPRLRPTCSATPPASRPSSPAMTCFSSPDPNAAGSCRPGRRRAATAVVVSGTLRRVVPWGEPRGSTSTPQRDPSPS